MDSLGKGGGSNGDSDQLASERTASSIFKLPERPRRATLSESVAGDIESLILRGDLKDGERLPPESELGNAFGVSRSVVRDAVRMLLARGLIDVRQGQGTVVSTPSSNTFGDAMVALLMRSELTMGEVIDARAALETQIAPLAARNGLPEDWDALEERLDRLRKAVEDRRWQDAHEENLQFHLAILQATHLPALTLLLSPLQQCVVLTSLPPVDDNPDLWDVESHPEILAALRSGDEAAAVAAMEKHFKNMSELGYDRFRDAPFRAAARLDDYRSFRSAGVAEPA